MLALRNSKPVVELDSLSREVESRLLELPVMRKAKTVSTYLHIGSEVRTSGIVNWAISNGKRIIVPVTDRANLRLVFSEIRQPTKELGRGFRGIPEPKPEFRRPVRLEEADVVLVPGVAWDQRGYRIGYGSGYYDRSINALQSQPTKLGLAYEFQIVPVLPRTRFDRRVDKIVTERRSIETISAANALSHAQMLHGL
jgi:5-formyltetrahydrofolate cyclo-ligase